MARSYTRSPSEFDELFQEMLFQLWVSTKSFSGAAKATTWIYRVCLNTALTWRRQLQRRSALIDESANRDLAYLPSDVSSPSDAAGRKDVFEHVFASIQRMLDGDRVLILLSLEGLPYGEIADIVGTSENRVGVGLTRARQRLADLLKGIRYELE